MQYLQDMYLQSQPFDPLPIHDINIYSAERDFYSIIERICNLHAYISYRDLLRQRQDWPGMIFVYVINVSQTFDTGVYFKPYN